MVDRDKFSDFSRNVRFLDARIRVTAPTESTEPLPVDFEPGNWDVICQGGKESYDHIGNRRFRLCIENNLHRYSKATSKHERSLVVTTIVDAIRDSRTSEQGGFVRKDVASGRWYEVGDKTAREKVGHALRDAIKFKNREQQCQSIESHDQDHQLKHRSKKRRRTIDVSVSQSYAHNSPVPTLSLFDTRKSISSETLNKQRKDKIQTVHSVSTTIIEAEWEMSLKESSKQFQDSDDESDSVDNDFRNGALTVKQVSDQTPSPIHSATQSFKPPVAMAPDVTETTSAAPTLGMAPSFGWHPPGFSDFEDQFAEYMRSLGRLNDQPSGRKEDASMTTPFPKTSHDTLLEGCSRNLGMPKKNDTAQPLYGCESVVICDSDDTRTCL